VINFKLFIFTVFIFPAVSHQHPDTLREQQRLHRKRKIRDFFVFFLSLGSSTQIAMVNAITERYPEEMPRTQGNNFSQPREPETP
jgi:hypothetical protein